LNFFVISSTDVCKFISRSRAYKPVQVNEQHYPGNPSFFWEDAAI